VGDGFKSGKVAVRQRYFKSLSLGAKGVVCQHIHDIGQIVGDSLPKYQVNIVTHQERLIWGKSSGFCLWYQLNILAAYHHPRFNMELSQLSTVLSSLGDTLCHVDQVDQLDQENEFYLLIKLAFLE
jgi:hypothetical protein